MIRVGTKIYPNTAPHKKPVQTQPDSEPKTKAKAKAKKDKTDGKDAQ